MTSVRRRRPGSRHPRDVLSLVSGLLLLAVAGAALLAGLEERPPGLRWAVPAVLLAIGTVGLAATLRRGAPPGRPPQDEGRWNASTTYGEGPP